MKQEVILTEGSPSTKGHSIIVLTYKEAPDTIIIKQLQDKEMHRIWIEQDQIDKLIDILKRSKRTQEDIEK